MWMKLLHLQAVIELLKVNARLPMVKLDGPASINGDTLQIAVYNPTGLTIG